MFQFTKQKELSIAELVVINLKLHSTLIIVIDIQGAFD